MFLPGSVVYFSRGLDKKVCVCRGACKNVVNKRAGYDVKEMKEKRQQSPSCRLAKFAKGTKKTKKKQKKQTNRMVGSPRHKRVVPQEQKKRTVQYSKVCAQVDKLDICRRKYPERGGSVEDILTRSYLPAVQASFTRLLIYAKTSRVVALLMLR